MKFSKCHIYHKVPGIATKWTSFLLIAKFVDSPLPYLILIAEKKTPEPEWKPYIPSEPSPILTGFYSEEGQFWLSMVWSFFILL